MNEQTFNMLDALCPRPPHLQAKWREGMIADLSRANLSGADLAEANLSWANLSDANMSVAYLFRADLTYANLYRAYLSRANLPWANLTSADLSGANLTYANLTDACLHNANLTGADLSGASGTFATAYLGKHHSVAAGGFISIGCERHPFDYWLENYYDIGLKNHYSRAEIERHGAWIRLVVEWLGREQ